MTDKYSYTSKRGRMAARSAPSQTTIGALSKSATMVVMLIVVFSSGCSTTFVEMKGECVLQQWQFLGQNIRTRMICDLPPPTLLEEPVRDREAMDTNPFPDLIDLGNPADSADPNLLEKEMEYPQNAD